MPAPQWLLTNDRIPIPRTTNRLLHVGLAALLCAGLLIGAVLPVSPNGIGTHQRLGLPSCLVARIIGLPRCPSCGLTTACCHILQGRWQEAQACHPAAWPVFSLAVLTIIYNLLIAFLGKNWLLSELLVSACLSMGLGACWFCSLLQIIGRTP